MQIICSLLLKILEDAMICAEHSAICRISIACLNNSVRPTAPVAGLFWPYLPNIMMPKYQKFFATDALHFGIYFIYHWVVCNFTGKKKKNSKQHNITQAGRDKLGEVRVNESSVCLTSSLRREAQLSGVNGQCRSRCCRQMSRLIYLKHQRRALGRAPGENTPT